MSEFRIREATSADVEVLVHHRLGMFRDMGVPPAEVAAMEEPARAYFRRAVPAGKYVAFLAEYDDRVIAGGGIIVIDWPAGRGDARDSKAMILNMYTEPDIRRRGLARRLMEAMIAWCREQGYRTVSLHASDYGRPLYESLGFKPTNEMRLTL